MKASKIDPGCGVASVYYLESDQSFRCETTTSPLDGVAYLAYKLIKIVIPASQYGQFFVIGLTRGSNNVIKWNDGSPYNSQTYKNLATFQVMNFGTNVFKISSQPLSKFKK